MLPDSFSAQTGGWYHLEPELNQASVRTDKKITSGYRENPIKTGMDGVRKERARRAGILSWLNGEGNLERN